MDPSVIPNSIKTYFSKSILCWFKKNGRNFPWRKNSNPYEVMVAEILLQRTTAAQVEKIFTPFLKKFPNLNAIISNDIKELEKIIKPIGLYGVKAKRFKIIAKMLITKKKIPQTRDELIKLPGIGPYIANAIKCFAFSEQVPIVDTNVSRVFGRFFDIPLRKSNPERDPFLWSLASSLIQKGKSRELNYGLIDFGALVCKKRGPLCNICVIRDKCHYNLKRKINNSFPNLTNYELL